MYVPARLSGQRAVDSTRGASLTLEPIIQYTQTYIIYTWVMVVLRIGFTGHAEWEDENWGGELARMSGGKASA